MNESPPRDPDRAFAEWFAWAKREVSADERTCYGVAQAALDAEQEGLPGEAIARRARVSVGGQVALLTDQVPPDRRVYAQWYDWARVHFTGDPARLHTATLAAVDVLRGGGDAGQAARAARNAAGLPAEGRPPETAARARAAAARPEPAGPPPPAPPSRPSQFYAGFGPRAGAFLVDSAVLAALLIGVLVVAAFLLLLGATAEVVQSPWRFLVYGLWAFVLWFLLAWIYCAGLESSPWQATLGKRALGLVVVDGRGRRVSFLRASVRFLGGTLSGLLLGIGYLVAAFTRRHQALQDHGAYTLVVRRDYARGARAVIDYLDGSSPRPEPPQPAES
ncbi:MAG: RDD family protein, partial [bacterium]|nr:RDD family protein [bacterium]